MGHVDSNERILFLRLAVPLLPSEKHGALFVPTNAA